MTCNIGDDVSEKILVAGGTEPLQRSITTALLEAGHSVRLLSFAGGNQPAVQKHSRFALWSADPADPATLEGAPIGCDAVVVVHHSLHARIGPSGAADAGLAERVTQAASRAGVKRLSWSQRRPPIRVRAPLPRSTV
jgi:uncharacterized protein YbjT (DUF2867 family)